MLLRRLAGAAIGLAAAVAPLGGPAVAQGAPGAARNPTCIRLEAQLSAFDRSSSDPARAEQIRRVEDAVARQQNQIDRAAAQSQRLGCDTPGFFQLFNPQQAQQCGPLTRQIQDMRTNLSRMTSDLQRLQGSGASYERDGQRRAILAALAQNDCGPQYQQAAAPQGRTFFEQLFGGGTIVAPEPEQPMGSGFRTVCVRTCDGFFFPISFSTSPQRFRDDERACQRMCPATETVLFSYRNPGEDISRAVSINGQPYTALANAFRYKKEFNPACSCKRPGESWAEALQHLDERQTAREHGDIVVTEERARQLSAPRDAKGRAILPPKAAAQNAAAPQAPAPDQDATAAGETAPRPIRSVGPKFLPAQ